MRKLLLIIALLLGASPCFATSYFISPSGSDSNNGLSTGAAWLSPNHAVNCGDTLTAAAGTYSTTNLNTGKWGTVTCPSSNNVAWVICATFDACKVSVSSGTLPAIWIDNSYWGIAGFEATTTTGVTDGACFEAGVPSSGRVAHHIIFVNDVADGCAHGGFVTFNAGTTGGVDYVVMVGNIAYNTSGGSSACASGFSIYQPIASDSNAGTHIYIAGNYSYANVDGNPCGGTPPTDGEGVIIDTLDFSQGGGTPYTQQVVVQNNIDFSNGGRGMEVFNNQAGSTHATVYFKYNTAYGDNTDNNQTNGCLGRSELAISYTKNTVYDHNLAQTRTGTSCSSAAIYALFAETVDSSSSATNNWVYSAAGNNTGLDNATGFTLTGTTTSNPNFSNPVNPGAPSCGSFSSVATCMATVISDYTPTTGGASAYGHQTVSNTSITDALFPQWLCTSTGVLNANIPAGLVTPGCGVSGVIPITAGSSTATIQAAISGASSGSTISFAAGTYTTTSTLNLKCGVNMTGPAVTPSYNTYATATILTSIPTANFVASGASIGNVFNWPTCTTAMSFTNIHTSGAGGIYANLPISNMTVQHNVFDHLPANLVQGQNSGIYFIGSNTANQLQSTLIDSNVFGDSTSCTTPTNVMTSTTDNGGICDAIMTNGGVNGLTVTNNVFYHLENGGPKILCTGPGSGSPPPYPCETGSLGSQVATANILVANNHFEQIHRIGIEVQPQPMTNFQQVNNSFQNTFQMTAFGMGFSDPCCNNGAANPGEITNDNTMLFENAPGGRIAYIFEHWGNGAQGNNNLMQGYMYFGFAWGRSNSAWAINNNTIQAVSGSTFNCFICDEGYGSTPAPTTTGNATGFTITQQASVAPSISPAGGAKTFPLNVTLTDAGYTSGPLPQGNHSIYYTTDGSTPNPGCNFGSSGCTTLLYTGPFTLTTPATVNAVGKWGKGGNTVTYPVGYGWATSSMITATYTAGSAPTLTSCSQSNSGGVTTIGIGGTVDQVTNCFYASVPTTTVCSPGADVYGNQATAWGASGGITIGAIGSAHPGRVTGTAAGAADSTATVASTNCSNYSFTVTSPTLTGVSISLLGGGTSVNVGGTAQACATMTYTGLAPTVVCGGGSDIYGTTPNTWTSSSGSVASISTSGLLSGLSPGTTNIGVSAGSFTSTPEAITVNALPAASVLSGSPAMSGRVVIQ
jgi:hypothetical protein